MQYVGGRLDDRAIAAEFGEAGGEALGAGVVGTGRQADQDALRGDQDVAAVGQARLGQLEDDVEELAEDRRERISFGNPARRSWPKEDCAFR